MKFAVCTLFEKHYHFGVAILINSLYRHGYRGDIFVGYRGDLPEWTNEAKDNHNLAWEGAKTLIVKEDLSVHFLPVNIDFQFTNYKPGMMLKLFGSVCKDADAIAYFDPDIIVRADWGFFERWIAQGVALVHEIVSNDMPPTHPIRREWVKVIDMCGRNVTREMHSYINAGFCGALKRDIEFLTLWDKIMEVGKTHFNFNATTFQFAPNRSDIFFAKDQDALNIAAMCSVAPISEMGPEAMDFIPGGFTMSHAVGYDKPWTKQFLTSALKAVPPTTADKTYWLNVDGPIQPYPASLIKRKRMALKVSSVIGRFYGRN